MAASAPVVALGLVAGVLGSLFLAVLVREIRRYYRRNRQASRWLERRAAEIQRASADEEAARLALAPLAPNVHRRP